MCSALDIPVGIVFGALSLDQLGIPARTVIRMETASYAIPIGFTVIVTGLVATRLMLARRQHMKVMGKC